MVCNSVTISSELSDQSVLTVIDDLTENISICHLKLTQMDRIWRNLKSCVYCDLMPGKCVIGTTKQFAEHADRAVKGITPSYLPVEDVLVVPDDIEVSPRIKEN